MMTGKEARQYAKTAKHCSAPGCTNAPGGHGFKFPGAKDMCLEHARKEATARANRVARKTIVDRAANREAAKKNDQAKLEAERARDAKRRKKKR